MRAYSHAIEAPQAILMPCGARISDWPKLAMPDSRPRLSGFKRPQTQDQERAFTSARLKNVNIEVVP